MDNFVHSYFQQETTTKSGYKWVSIDESNKSQEAVENRERSRPEETWHAQT